MSPLSNRRHLDERGVALPLAILGLIFVTFLFVGLMFTSGTEAAIGSAHQDAVRSLHSTDGAIHAFVGDFADTGNQIVPGEFTQTGAQGDYETTHQMLVSRVGLRREVTPPVFDSLGVRTDPGEIEERDVFSIRAVDETESGGRSVGALVEAVYRWNPINIASNEGVAVGGELNVRGNAQISANTSMCEDQEGYAIRRTEDVLESDLSYDSTNVDGQVGVIQGVQSHELIEQTIGVTAEEFLQYATLLFDGETHTYHNNTEITSFDRELTDPYNWGCPVEMMDCSRSPDAVAHFPLIYIDATTTTNNTVSIQNRFGQGILFVKGNLDISAQFMFKGIIIVDGAIRITGGSGSTVDPETGEYHRIEGSLVATGAVHDERDNQDDSTVGGGAVVRYNRCMLDQVQNSSQQRPPGAEPGFERGPFGWFEVVR